MADIADLQNTLVTSLAEVLFAPGYLEGAPSASLLPGSPVIKLYRGWPNASTLDADLRAGTSTVTVFVDPGAARLTSRFEWLWKPPQAAVAPSLLVTTSNGTVTFSGTCSTSQVAGVQLYNNPPVTYRCLSTDTPSTVASALAALLPEAFPTVTGASISFPAQITAIEARTGCDQVSMLETRRQEQVVRITIWTPTPALRDLISAPIDSYMAYVRTFIFPDGTCSNVPLSRGTYIDDVPDVAHEWRRDLKYAIEYPTIYTQTQTPILFPFVEINGNYQNIFPSPILTDVQIELETGNGALLAENGEYLVFTQIA